MRFLAILGAALLMFCGTSHAEQRMGVEDARHLLARTGFTPTAAEIVQWSALPRTEAVERLLRAGRDEARTTPPDEVRRYLRPEPAAMLSEEEKKARNADRNEQGRALRVWWLKEMLLTDSPLTERMTLFWHNHFVSSMQKVREPALIYRQNTLLRREALGSFSRMLHAAAKDPAMVLYLDAASSKKDAPNENFAREVMELFTLGEGHYTEQDVKEAARAFTGWGFDRPSGDFIMRPRLHDDGSKTVLGNTGRLDGDGVLDILLSQRATAEFITAKLWREFVSPTPDKKEVSRIARRFYDNDYDIRVVLREIFNSPAFWLPANRGTLVKSPVELVVGSVRMFGLANTNVGPVANAQAHINQMGQNLFAPPNVKGWPGGDAWIDSSTLLKRREFMAKLSSVGALNPALWQREVERLGLDAKLVLLGGLQPDSPDGGVAAWVADARFQLK